MIIGYDVETFPIRPGLAWPRMVCGSFSDGTLLLREEALDRLEQHLRNGDVIVGHNIQFDMGVALRHRPHLFSVVWDAYTAGRIRCTLVRDQLLTIRDGLTHLQLNLGAVAKRRLGVIVDKKNPWRTRFGELDGIPVEEWPQGPDGPAAYVLEDTAHLPALFEAQSALVPEGEDGLVSPDEPMQTTAAFCLALAGGRGIRTDPVRVKELRERVYAEFKAAERQLKTVGLLRPKRKRDPDGTQVLDTKHLKALVDAAYVKLGRPAPLTDHATKPTTRTDSDTIEQVKALDPALSAISTYKNAQKMLTTYIDKLEHGTKYALTSSPNVLVATGRTSWRNPNLQNQPREPGFRECFVPRAGYAFVQADYSSLELRTLGQVCHDLLGESTLARLYQADREADPHSLLGAQTMHISYEEFLARRAAGDKEVKARRDLAKCFHPDTEVLTREGWKRIADLRGDEEVATPYPSRSMRCDIRWEVPQRLTQRPHRGVLVHMHNKGTDLRVTPDHRMMGYAQGANPEPREFTPYTLNNARYWLNAGLAEGDTVVNLDLLRLAVATQADGSFLKPGKGIRYGFTKQRKIDRLSKVLDALGADYTRSINRQGVTTFKLRGDVEERVRALLTPTKQFPWWWLRLSIECRRAVLEELPGWDGWRRRQGRSFKFNNCDQQSIEVIQAIGCITNNKTIVSRYVSPDENHRDIFEASVKDHPYSRGGNLVVEEVPYDGTVYCLTTRSDYILVRDRGKTVVTHQCASFGYPGGMGVEKFITFARASYGVNFTYEEAAKLRDDWFQTYPEMREYFGLISTLVDRNQPLIQLRSGRVRGHVGFCDACNSFFQGLAADGAKSTLATLTQEMWLDRDSALYGSRLVAFIHDEFILETPIDLVHDAAKRLEEIMVVGMEEYTPDVPNHVEACAMWYWSKEAKPVYDAGGKLIPWPISA